MEHLGFAESGTQEYVFNEFGNTGLVGNLPLSYTANMSSTENFSNVFGNRLGVTLSVVRSAKINESQLVSGSRVLATIRTATPGDVLIWTSEDEHDGKVIWCTDVNMFENFSGPIDTDQERFLHNMMAYALQKAGL